MTSMEDIIEEDTLLLELQIMVVVSCMDNSF